MGGMRIGLEQALEKKGIDCECVLTSEIKPHALKVYKENFGDRNIVGDITKVKGKDIPDFDMLLAGFPCFPKGTLVYTDNGFKNIEDIEIGDRVLTHTHKFQEVLEVFEKTTNELYTLNLRNIELKATSNHPIYVGKMKLRNSDFFIEDIKWVEMKDITTDDYVCIPSEIIKNIGISVAIAEKNFTVIGNNYWFPVLSIDKESVSESVYNLSVAVDNSYTANYFVVHNCQPFSSAGKQKGFDDTRGTLFFEIARILKEKQPKYFLLENVENLVIHDMSREDKKNGKTMGKTLETILYVLKDLGYNVTWKVLQASDYGIPQLRRRIYIVGCKDKEVSLDSFEKKECCFADVMEHIAEPKHLSDFNKSIFKYLEENNLPISHLYDKAIRDKRGSSNNIHSWTLGLRGEVTESQHDLLEKMVTERRRSDLAQKKGVPLKDGVGLTRDEMLEIYNGNNIDKDIEVLLKLGYLKIKNIEGYSETLYDIVGGKLSYEFTKILDPTKPSLTIVATEASKTGVVDGNCIRKLTLTEGLRLSGYPSWYKLNLPYNKGMDLIGNTVVVPIIKMICDRLVE